MAQKPQWTALDGSVHELHEQDTWLFFRGRPCLGATDGVPEAPDSLTIGADGRYFAWTRWGDPPIFARSTCQPTAQLAHQDLANAISRVRDLMTRRAEEDPCSSKSG